MLLFEAQLLHSLKCAGHTFLPPARAPQGLQEPGAASPAGERGWFGAVEGTEAARLWACSRHWAPPANTEVGVRLETKRQFIRTEMFH